ncbi:MAG: pirin family protein, partial [Dongiaceae bacterium]
PTGHWVGDGFPVRSMFSYNRHGAEVSPFLLLDYAGPAEFQPASHPRGVEMHPHRGFETVTIVYQGEVEHRDTAGNRGTGRFPFVVGSAVVAVSVFAGL